MDVSRFVIKRVETFFHARKMCVFVCVSVSLDTIRHYFLIIFIIFYDYEYVFTTLSLTLLKMQHIY